MAYAGIVGVPPIMGLYTLVPPLLAYALLGTSRLLVVGPDTATGLISALTVGTIAAQGTSEFNSQERIPFINHAIIHPPVDRNMAPGAPGGPTDIYGARDEGNRCEHPCQRR
jgi:hypothetical protein